MPELSVALIQDAVRGDRRAVRELVDLLLPMVHYRVGRALIRRRSMARARDVRQEVEDLIQSVFLFFFSNNGYALLHWTPGRGTSLTNYIGLLAEREVISILRSRRRSPWAEEPTLDDELDQQFDLGPPVDVRVGSREMLSLILDQVRARLNDRNLELFHLLFVEERSVEEICTLMDMTPDAVYSSRARLARLARTVAAELVAEREPGKPIPGHA